ncbi:peptide-N-glycosidase [Flavihumibacter sp. R14]|nr:peptide-N-glycosidase [Flavihumibacter soli]
MKNIIRLFVVGLLVIHGFTARAVDTLHVTTHKRATVVTDPAKGYKLYKQWGVFPKADVPIRKIMMRVKFGCPDSMRCADWDYMDRISIARTGGLNGKVQDFEIGRMLTPYGGAFGKDWNFEWEVDVTDFALLLRDSVEIEYKHTGYEPNTDRGWAITVEFDLIKGKPAYEPIAIQKIYDNSYRYGDNIKPLEHTLKPVSFVASANASLARLRLVQTGHGMDEPDGCGEFCNKYREIWFDGKLIDKRSIWKECGDNPLYPQAGTWVIDRANWCPGNLMQPDLFDLKVNAGKEHLIEARMQNYVSSKPSADEVISAYLIQYRETGARDDAAVEDILVPSSKPIFSRQNPAASNAVIRVKNLGANNITSLDISYGTNGFKRKLFKWNGIVEPAKTASITLPGTIDFRSADNIFTADIIKTNGKKDSYRSDNSVNSRFHGPALVADTLVFYLQTNNQPEQNSYILKNHSGRTIKERTLGSLKANTIYRDTLILEKGAYTFAFTDTAGDGLELWFNRKGGRGLARFENTKGQIVKTFESDSGSGWEFNFAVNGRPDPIDKDEVSIGLYPTRTQDKTTLDYFANKKAEILVRLVADPGGQVLESHRYNDVKEGVFTFNLEHYSKGRFYMQVFVNGEQKFNKRIRFKE